MTVPVFYCLAVPSPAVKCALLCPGVRDHEKRQLLRAAADCVDEVPLGVEAQRLRKSAEIHNESIQPQPSKPSLQQSLLLLLGFVVTVAAGGGG
jgi:hypothetical protein